ncbi:hypothetical protein nbrc107696_23720 [Gordonia spumicola]|uniref:Uncharacterized protein n=1 Tax=Gordonia spumicola TaxID=589161 RepID=A0A7I9V946_9ACTN|nr:hypothetical protein nbrc107696_23720 [Gordonia spumicola]
MKTPGDTLTPATRLGPTIDRRCDPPRSDALKLLSSEFAADAAFRARFAREADIAASHRAMVTRPSIDLEAGVARSAHSRV